MNTPQIILKRIGYSNTALIVNGTNSILVDTAVRGHLQNFKILFRENELNPSDIKLIVLTHTHYDHTGNLHALVKLTGAKVLVHGNEFENLKKGFTPIPKGLGLYSRLIANIGRKIYPKYASPKAFDADIVNKNKFDLNEFGLDAKIISTPGHTLGSQSVLIGKKLIAGDTFLNLSNGIIFPHFANHPELLVDTWQKLFDMGIEKIYPGHGTPFNTEKAFVEFEKWKGKTGISFHT